MVEKYLWANLTTLLAIYDADDNVVQRFEYADNRMPISMTSNGQKYYLHYDQVGTLKAVSDTSHNIVKEISYDTYGNILSETNEALKVPFGFAGGLYDTDTKLTRFGYRDYDAYTGKWTAKDPIDFGGGDSNLYGYVLQDPVNFVDPSGLASWIDLILPTPLGFERERYGKKYRKVRWFPSTGKIIPIDSSTGKLISSPKLKCEMKTVPDSEREWGKQLRDAERAKVLPAARKGRFGTAMNFLERIMELF